MMDSQNQSEKRNQYQATKQRAVDQGSDDVFMSFETEPVESISNSSEPNSKENLAAQNMDFDKENIDVDLLKVENQKSGLGSIENATVVDGSGDNGIINSHKENETTVSDADMPTTTVSVKERTEKFNHIASESELTLTTVTALTTSPGRMASSPRMRRDPMSKNESRDDDSLSSYAFGFAHMQPNEKEWIYKAAQCEYYWLNKAAQENPDLVKRKDINTALHWAAKHGNADLIKLLAGTFKSDINARSNGGYTPLHLAAQFSREDAYDILSKVYNADVNLRDHSGKKPMQYLVRKESAVTKSVESKLIARERQRVSSVSSNSSPSSSHARLSQTFSNGSADMPYYTVSLPTCNTNSTALESSNAPTQAAFGGDANVERTGLVTLTSFVHRNPSNASSIGRVNSFRSSPSMHSSATRSLSGSIQSQSQKPKKLGEKSNSSDSGSLNEGKPVNRIPSFLSPFKNADDMRRSFRQGVRKMWNGHPKPDRDVRDRDRSAQK